MSSLLAPVPINLSSTERGPVVLLRVDLLGPAVSFASFCWRALTRSSAVALGRPSTRLNERSSCLQGLTTGGLPHIEIVPNRQGP